MRVQDNRAVNLGGKIYSIGGATGSTLHAKNYVYDPFAQTWTPIADLPGARQAMAVGVVDGKIIATGGWGPSGPDSTTWSYDPRANTWTKKADNPAPRAGAGQAVADGKLYAIGGCTTAGCAPVSNTVVRYSPGSDTWETLPNYPKSVTFVSCGGIDGIVYCTGGADAGSVGTKASYAFDPKANAWTAVADAPADSWGSAYAVANGKLMIVGGAQGGGITNVGFAYDPAANSWSSLPKPATALYRGGAACGFYRVGGATATFTASPASDVLPGFDQCVEEPGDVSWMTVDRTSATLAPGQKVKVTVGMTANVSQPGTYTSAVAIKHNTPYPVLSVGVTLTAKPPKSWAKLLGTVTATNCEGVNPPLTGAIVQVDAKAGSWTLITDYQGRYAYWLDSKHSPLRLIVAKDSWKPQTREVKIKGGKEAVEDFALSPLRCD